MGGLRQDQDHDVSPTLTLAQPHPPGQGLDVAHSRLDLDADNALRNPYNHIPGADISRIRKQHLSSNAPRVSEDCDQLRDDCLVALVANRLSGWVQTK